MGIFFKFKTRMSLLFIQLNFLNKIKMQYKFNRKINRKSSKKEHLNK